MKISTATADRLGIRHEWADGKPAASILSAAGHPGYGAKFARQVLARFEADPSVSLHQLIYGRRP